MLLSLPAGFRGFQARRRYKAITQALRAVTSGYTAVTELLLVVTEPLLILRAVTELDGSKEPVPHNGSRSGPSLPRRIVGLGEHPPGAATGGFSMVSPQYIRYAAGSKEEKRAGGPLHGDTIAQSFSFCNGAGSGWRGGSGWACAVIPPAPPSDVFQNRGAPPVPPAGAAPPAPCLGRDGDS